MRAPSSWREPLSKLLERLKHMRSAFLKWPAWVKGGLVFGSALLVFNALGASSYFSYRWRLESSQQIPRARELLTLCNDAIDQLQVARDQEQLYLGRRKGGGLRAYQAALVELNARLARLKARAVPSGPSPDHDQLIKLGAQLLQLSRNTYGQAVDSSGIEVLGVHIERVRPPSEKGRTWALATAKEEAKLAAIQGLLHEMKSAQEAQLADWTRLSQNASRIFTASIVFGNLLAFALISLGGHSLMFHIGLSESSSQALKELQLFADAAPEASYSVDLEGRCNFCNRALLRLLGYQSADELLGQQAHRLVFAPPQGQELAPELQELLQTLAEDRAFHGSDGTAWRADGGRLRVEFWSNPVHVDGRRHGSTVTLLDVTQARASREKLERANESLKGQVVDLSRHSREMSAFSELTELLQASTSTQELCKVVTVFIKQLFHEEAGALYLLKEPGKTLVPISSWGESSPLAQPFSPEDCWSLRRAKPHYEESGKEGLFCAHLPEPLPDFSLCLPLIAQGGTLGLLHIHAQAGHRGAQLSESKQLLAMALAQQVALGLSNLRLRDFLREDSIRDALTGLYNRRYMKESLDHEISRASRNGGSVGLIAFDLDHFKAVNDSRGHATGDQLLHALGSLVKDCVRAEDIACRYGGDEFLVILPGINPEHALTLAEVLRTKTEALAPDFSGPGEEACTLSAGVALYPQDAQNAEALQLAADRALYRAKAEGRNRVASAPRGRT